MSFGPRNPSDETVSWQTAFWAVFATGGNTFIQDPGTVLDNKDMSGRGLRVSPILCLFDATWMLYVFLNAWVRDRDGPAAAADKVLRERNIDTGDLWHHQWYLRLVFGFFFAFVPLVKLCGMQGVPFTIVCACFYFAGYLVLEALKVIAGWRSRASDTTMQSATVDREETDREGEERLLPIVVLVFGILLHLALTVTLLADLPDKFTENIEPSQPYTYVNRRGRERTGQSIDWYCRPLQYFQIFQSVLLYVISTFGNSRRQKRSEMTNFFAKLCEELLTVVILLLPVLGVFSLNRWAILISWLGSLLQLGTIVWAVLQLVSKETGKHWFAIGAFQFSAFVFVMVAFIHYIKVYEPEGTFKPEWTESLG